MSCTRKKCVGYRSSKLVCGKQNGSTSHAVFVLPTQPWHTHNATCEFSYARKAKALAHHTRMSDRFFSHFRNFKAWAENVFWSLKTFLLLCSLLPKPRCANSLRQMTAFLTIASAEHGLHHFHNSFLLSYWHQSRTGTLFQLDRVKLSHQTSEKGDFLLFLPELKNERKKVRKLCCWAKTACLFQRSIHPCRILAQ